jgi:hypothetical protein
MQETAAGAGESPKSCTLLHTAEVQQSLAKQKLVFILDIQFVWEILASTALPARHHGAHSLKIGRVRGSFMRVPRNILRVVLALAIAATCSVAAHADSSNDPRVVIKDAEPGQNVSGLNFGFSLPGPTGGQFTGDLDFTNTGSQTWTTLALFESAVPASLVSCGANAFFNRCTVSHDPRTLLTEILFYNVVGCGHLGTGILAGENFTLGFGPGKGSKVSWPAGTSFTGVATAVPEPSTIAFLFTGIGVIATRRKLWKRAS